ncbi:MAG TPA: hypothetical protein VKZ58_11150, partial [Longimicrobiales bacterium]|nr:hypothetical protein [Longimicrobiales bacterium]
DKTALKFQESEGVTVDILTADETGYSATAEHRGTDKICAVFYGDADPVEPATVAGVVTCSTDVPEAPGGNG